MKKFFLIFLPLLIGALLVIGIFAWKNLRGVGPAVRKPPEDIARMVRNATRRDSRLPLTLAKGFSLSIFAKDLGKARVLAEDPGGTLLVSIPADGKVVALPDREGDGKADSVVTVAAGLKGPHGLAFRCREACTLFIAQEDRVDAYAYDSTTLQATWEKKLIDLPKGGFHVTRTLLYLPEQDSLLVSVGSSCNVCSEKDWRRAAVLSVPAGGGKPDLYSSGLRNAVFLAVNFRTGMVWATEMGRDMLGDDRPPDEIDILSKGGNYGWPYCYGKNVHDDGFDPGRKHACREPETLPSHIDIPAHSAPLGLAFFPEGWPKEFRNDLLVAYHGSWNRSVPTGYKIVRYHLDEQGRELGHEDLVTGWLTPEGRALGRPVDIVIRKDRTIYVSDDKAGVVYRLTYKE